MSSGRRLAGFVAGAMLLPAFARAQVAKLPPVEVVATRIAENPEDVPASIEVISGDDLRARGARTLREALALATGVAIAPGGDAGPAGAVPEFWGLREFDAFLLVVDNVPWGGALNPDLATLSLRDVERIEVLRGPAPVTYGATSFVGVIHVVHKKGSDQAKYLNAWGGSYGSAGGSADLGLFKSGSWTSRLTADYDRQQFRDDRAGVSRGHALLRFDHGGESSHTWLNADVNILKQDPASPHPREGATLSSAVPLDANYNPAGAFLDQNRFNFQAGFVRPVTRNASWTSMASVTRSEQHMFRGFLTDLSNSPDNASGSRENIELTDLYADTHVLWPKRAGFQLLTGADLLFANGEARGAVFDYTVPLDGSSAAVVPEPTTLDRDAENRRIFGGVYASADMQLTDRISLNGGLRFNATNERRNENMPSASNNKLSGSIGAMAGLWQQGANHVRLFGNYRSTFKPAAFDFGLAENEGILKPETSKSWEAGIKAQAMDGRLGFDVSYFHMDFSNLVTATIVNNQPALINSGKTRFQGVELAGDLRLTDELSARATYAFHDGKFVDFVQDFDGTPTQLAGNRFEMSARHLASGGLTYAPADGLLLTGTVNYTGDRYLNKRNTALAPAFATFDAGIAWRWQRYELRVDGRNLGNRRDAISESEFGDAQYYRMPARTIQAGVSLRY